MSKRKLRIAALAGGLILVPVPTAVGHPGHTGCAAFGQQHVAGDAQTFRPVGQFVRQFTPVNEHIAADHAALCD